MSSFTEFPEVWAILDTRTAGPHLYDFYDNVFYEFEEGFNQILSSKTFDWTLIEEILKSDIIKIF